MGPLQFESRRQVMLRKYHWIMADDAQGFVSDLRDALEGAGLTDLEVTWRGQGLFTATGAIVRGGRDCSVALLDALGKSSYGQDRCAAAVSEEAGRVVVAFATWTAEIGVATLRVEATCG